MRNLLLIPLAAGLLLGCHKKPASLQTNSESPEVQAGAASSQPSSPGVAAGSRSQPLPPPPPPSPSVIARAENTVRENVVGEVDASLTSELRTFVQKQGRLPQNFGEFATVRLDSIPRPPEGKKWVIDSANLQVKAVTSK